MRSAIGAVVLLVALCSVSMVVAAVGLLFAIFLLWPEMKT